jgi:hypothetical protein
LACGLKVVQGAYCTVVGGHSDASKAPFSGHLVAVPFGYANKVSWASCVNDKLCKTRQARLRIASLEQSSSSLDNQANNLVDRLVQHFLRAFVLG